MENALGSAGKSPAVTPTAAWAASLTVRRPRSASTAAGTTSMEAGVSRTVRPRREALLVGWSSGATGPSAGAVTVTAGSVWAASGNAADRARASGRGHAGTRWNEGRDSEKDMETHRDESPAPASPPANGHHDACAAPPSSQGGVATGITSLAGIRAGRSALQKPSQAPMQGTQWHCDWRVRCAKAPRPLTVAGAAQVGHWRKARSTFLLPVELQRENTALRAPTERILCAITQHICV